MSPLNLRSPVADEQLPKGEGGHESDEEKSRRQQDPIDDFPRHFAQNTLVLSECLVKIIEASSRLRTATVELVWDTARIPALFFG